MPNRVTPIANRSHRPAEPPAPPLSCPKCQSTNFVVALTAAYGIVRRCESCLHVWPDTTQGENATPSPSSR